MMRWPLPGDPGASCIVAIAYSPPTLGVGMSGLPGRADCGERLHGCDWTRHGQQGHGPATVPASDPCQAQTMAKDC
jgi:hypothetical protein